MQPSDLTRWLAAPADFAQGAALYAQLGGSAVYQQLFALGETGYSRQVLAQQLRLLAGQPQLALPAVTLHPANSPPSAPDSSVLASVRTQLKAARDERSHAHAQLTTPGLRQATRNKLAHRICQLTDQVLQLLSAETHVLEHGRRPGPVATPDVTDAGELRRRLDNLISLRSKLRKRPERAADLPELEAAIQLIREKLTNN